VAKAWFGAARDIDVTAEVERVRAPTLVLHRQNEQQMPVEVSRRLADRLPDGRLVELPGTTPTLFIEDQATDLRLVTDFVTGERTDFVTGERTDFVTGERTDFVTGQRTDFVTGQRTDLVTGGRGERTGRVARAKSALTPREAEVLRLLPSGDSNTEIARRLGIAVHTVERHLASIYRKIGARGRAEAVAYAMTENPHNI
jgi:DNA-binding CsgD family transcriptional regulator